MKLPVVLSIQEMHQVLSRLYRVPYRVCLTTIHACGLRLHEGVSLQVGDIDSARPMLHMRHGKGGQDRYVPLPEGTLHLLRQYWSTHRHPVWLFPAPARAGVSLAAATQPMDESGVQPAFRAALQASGISKAASVHTLRHSYSGSMAPPIAPGLAIGSCLAIGQRCGRLLGHGANERPTRRGVFPAGTMPPVCCLSDHTCYVGHPMRTVARRCPYLLLPAY